MYQQRIGLFLANHWPYVVIALFFAWPLLSRVFDFLSGRHKRKAQEAAIVQQQEQLAKQAHQLSEWKKELQERAAVLSAKSEALTQQKQHLNDLVRLRTVELSRRIASRDYLCSTPVFGLILSDSSSRLQSVLNSSMQISSPFNISAVIRSDSGESYSTTLYDCTCPDFTYRRQPCKHMLRLALEVGLLLSVNTEPLKQEISDLLSQRDTLLQESATIARDSELLTKKQQDFEQLLKEKQQSYPWLAKLYTDRCSAYDDEVIRYLKVKDHAATMTAARIEREVKKELRTWRIKAKQAEYQLCFYETLFPWLLTFKEVPPIEAFQYTKASGNAPIEDKELLRLYLSPEEYQRLSNTQRFQLALDRYISRKKNSWEVGIEYERYIGYLCEQAGYSVKYYGALAVKADMGRDLILEKEGKIILVQCKRWAKEKTIHENHVFQLAGSTYEYQYEHPEKEVTGAFVATIDFSPVAVRCAERLGIHLFPNISFQEYPRIKCNIGKDANGNTQKIYHLPMDQHYDHVKISKPGECYASTVAEAESLGFRRAYRWIGSSS